MKAYYEHAGITIYHGDCRGILPTLPKCDLLLTDPPYGIALENHGRNDGHRADKDWTIANDGDLAAASEVLDWASQSKMPTATFSSPWKPMPGTWRSLLVWDKGEASGAGGDTSLCFRRNWELIQVRDNAPFERGRPNSILRFPIYSSDFIDHPTPKPVELMEWLIGHLSRVSSTILDPFMGSGTTLVAAKNLGRKAIGIEIEERYCELAAKRLSQEVFDFEKAVSIL